MEKNTHMDVMVTKILEKLNIINSDAVRPGSLDESAYEDLSSIYDYVMKKDHFSPSEMKAIAEELGRLRKK